MIIQDKKYLSDFDNLVEETNLIVDKSKEQKILTHKDKNRYYEAFKLYNEKKDSSLMLELICDYLTQELERYINLREN